MTTDDYVVLTAARNEVSFLGGLHASLLAQTHPPRKWIISVNHSQDGTEALARGWAKEHAFISVLSISGSGPAPGNGSAPSFANKAKAIRRAYEAVREEEFAYVGILDADMRPEDTCFATLCKLMDANPEAGLSVGRLHEPAEHAIRRFLPAPQVSTWGAQFFRRDCFERIGFYRPLRWGGLDVLAALMAREHGWQTPMAPDARIDHARGMGSHRGTNLLKTQFRYGIRDQKLGMPFRYCLAKGFNRLGNRPRLLGSVAFVGGYLAGFTLPADPAIPDTCRRRMRREQLEILRERLRRRSKRRAP